MESEAEKFLAPIDLVPQILQLLIQITKMCASDRTILIEKNAIYNVTLTDLNFFS